MDPCRRHAQGQCGRHSKAHRGEHRSAVCSRRSELDQERRAGGEQRTGLRYSGCLRVLIRPETARTAEEFKLGRLSVLLVRMNADLAMGQTLLKNTGSGNLFTLFGEPDVVIEPTEDGLLTVEIRGVDVFDPTTGEVRAKGTEDSSVWMVDTAYDEESFFVRHCYFT